MGDGTTLDVDGYLRRVGFPGVPQVDLPSLASLQRLHLGAVPFENLHVFHRREVDVTEAWSVAKVLDGRGGWCFELNGAFSTLLSALGFRVDRLAATVLLDPDPPDEPDHLTLLVHLDRRYLVDVGFGESATRPLDLDHRDPVADDGAEHRITVLDDGQHQLERREPPDHRWRPQYRFTTEPRDLGSFAGMSHHLRTAPGLTWTEKPFATRLVPGGRVTLLSDRLKVRRWGVVEEVPVAPDRWADVLHQWFAMTP
jgi:N-hydroxyarylamine O-acetyltransferase